jgi:hypothetical protein
VEESPDERKVDLVERTELGAQSGVARAQVRLGDVELAAWYEHRLGTPAILAGRHVWTTGLDATFDHAVGDGGLRLWFDGFAGASWFEHNSKPVDGDDATFLAARFFGAAAICSVYVLALYGVTVVVTGLTGHWWPDRLATPGLELAAAVVVVVALSLLGSVLLTSTANGIAVFMLFGAGLVAGLLGQIGEALNADALSRVARWSSFALPFEALYQDGLNHLTSDTVGFTRYALTLGPFGGAQVGGSSLAPWAACYIVAVLAVAILAFRRADL